MQGSHSITRHRLFPVAIISWFAALFGLSTLALRGSLLEQFVLALHIDAALPAATPPLGFTAKLVVALLAALVGAGLGAVVARALHGTRREARAAVVKRSERMHAAADSARETAAPQPDTGADKPARSVTQRLRGRDAHPDAPARRPISAHEELGEEGLAALASSEPEAPFTLSSQMPAPLAAAPEEAAIVPENASWLAPLRRPVDIERDLPLPQADAAEPQAPAAPPPLASPLFAAALAQNATPPVAVPAPAHAEQANIFARAAQALMASEHPQPAPAAEGHERLVATPFEDMSQVELIERLALAMQRRRDRDATLRAEAEARGEPEAAPSFPIPGETDRARAVAELRVLRGGQADAPETPAPTPPAAMPVPGLVTFGRGGAAPSLPAPADEADDDRAHDEQVGATLHAALASLRRLK